MGLRIFTLIALIIACLPGFAQTFDQLSPDTTQQLAEDEIPIYNKAEIQARMKQLGSVIKPEYTPAVESYIKTYVLRRREKTAEILGKSVMYFPMFEKMFREGALPTELKYLSVIESALNPMAISRVGAVGLWQFMPATAKHYGMQITEFVDERRDPYKSTKGAIQYLQDQYKRYGDWALSIAAYNSGPGRVNRAIKRARTKNFWQLAKYLPRETRSYVPGFIAAAYMMNNYHHHQLSPKLPDLDLQMTESTIIFQSYTFHTIAQITGLATEIIRQLNPSYTQEFIPESQTGYSLVLPKRVMTAMRDFLALEVPDAKHQAILESMPVFTGPTNLESSKLYLKSKYIAKDGDRLEELADMFKCSVHCLKAWNKLRTSYLNEGQEIVLYQPREFRRFLLEKEDLDIPEGIPGPSLKTLEFPSSLSDPLSLSISELHLKESYFIYVVKKGETLVKIAEKFPGNTVKGLIKLNRITGDNPFKPGMKLKVKKY